MVQTILHTSDTQDAYLKEVSKTIKKSKHDSILNCIDRCNEEDTSEPTKDNPTQEEFNELNIGGVQ